MARRTSDVGVEECKGFPPPNDHTTSASSTPLPLGSWNLNTATRPTESQRSAGMARKRARYAQHRDQKSLTRTEERWKIPQSHRVLRIEGSAKHSRCTCVDRSSRSHHEQFRTQGSAHRAY